MLDRLDGLIRKVRASVYHFVRGSTSTAELLARVLVEVRDTNHYDILYFAPGTTVDAVGDLLARA